MRRLVLGLVLLLVTTAALAANQVPVVVAVDTSRSLSPADLEQLREALARHVRQLPEGIEYGLISFADEARWMVDVGASRDQLIAGLGQLSPEGSYTVLQDALIVAARELPEGGVILIATDGRDENSATTVDDVARLTAAHGVRIVAGSQGRRLDQRALRRLALLSKGEYVGRLDTADPSEVARVIEAARAEVAAEVAPASAVGRRQETRAAPSEPTREQPGSAPPPRPVQPVRTGGISLPWWVLLVAVLLVGGVALTVWFGVRQRAPAIRHCERCGAPMEAWESSCARCQITELEEASQSQKVASNAIPDESVLDPEVFKKSPVPAGLDSTMVLDEQPVLVARQRGKPSRSYVLPRDQIFIVGRAPDINTLQVEDPTVSAQHFKVVPREEQFYVVDLETTNGTLVNDERVKVRRLKSGDLIQAGSLQFEFTMKLRRLG
jgi:hypothetical protein